MKRKAPPLAWRALLAAAILATGSTAIAEDKGISVTKSISNADITIDVNAFDGSIESILFRGEFLQDNDLSWGIQVEDDTSTTAIFNYGSGFPLDVFKDGNTIVVLGTYAPATPKGLPGVNVDFARIYSIDPDDNGFSIETVLVNRGGLPVTLRYFDSIDPDLCNVDTYTDLTVSSVGSVPLAVAAGSCNTLPPEKNKKRKKGAKSLGLIGPSMAMGTADPRAVLSAGLGDESNGYFNIGSGDDLNQVFGNPADDDHQYRDPAMSAIFEVVIASGECTAVGLDFGIGVYETDALQEFIDVGNGAVPTAPVDCVLPVAPPPIAFEPGMYAATYPGLYFQVDLATAETELLSFSDCPFAFDLKGGPGGSCYMYDAEFDNGTGTLWAVGPSDGPYGYYYGGILQQYAQQNLATGETVSGPFEFDVVELPPRKAAKGITVVDTFIFHEVEDIEIAGDAWVAAVNSWYVEVIEDIVPSKVGSTYLNYYFNGSVVAPFDPVSGEVDVNSPLLDKPDELSTAMAWDSANGHLIVSSFPYYSDKSAEVARWSDKAAKGFPISTSYLTVVDLVGVGGVVTLYPPLPGGAKGLEFDGSGNLYAAVYEYPSGLTKGYSSEVVNLYLVELEEAAKACKGIGCLTVDATLVGDLGIPASSLMWVENTGFVDEGCDCPAGGGTVETADGRVANDATGANRDDAGRSVAVCEDTALVGAPMADPSGASSGTVYVAQYDGSSTWTLVGNLVSGSPAAGDGFGHSVAINGDIAVVGEPFDDANGLNAGAAHVYRRSPVKGGSAGWFHEATIYGSDAGVSDRFGYAVAVCGERIVVGAPYDMPSPRVGAAYVFEYTGGGGQKGASSWTETEKLVPSDGYSGDFFGASVAIDGDRIAVGSSGDDDLGSASGAVYVYTLSGGTWIEAKGVAADGASGDNLGTGVDIHGTMVVAGAPGEDDTAINSGAVYLFDSVSAASLVNIDRGKATSPGPASLMGSSVAIGPQQLRGRLPIGGGHLVAAGAPFDDQGGTDAGAAHLFAFGGAAKGGSGFELEKYIAVAPDSVDYNGTSVDLTGFTLLSGAPWGNRINSTTSEPGSVYFFTPGF